MHIHNSLPPTKIYSKLRADPHRPRSPPATRWSYPLQRLPLAPGFLLGTHHGRRESGHRFPLGRALQHVVDEVARPETTFNARKVVSLAHSNASQRTSVWYALSHPLRRKSRAVRSGNTRALRGTTDPVETTVHRRQLGEMKRHLTVRPSRPPAEEQGRGWEGVRLRSLPRPKRGGPGDLRQMVVTRPPRERVPLPRNPVPVVRKDEGRGSVGRNDRTSPCRTPPEWLLEPVEVVRGEFRGFGRAIPANRTCTHR